MWRATFDALIRPVRFDGDRLNRLLLGWSAYFGYGTRLQAYRAVDQHVYDRVQYSSV